MAENRSKSDQYLLRLPPGLREVLKEAADLHSRSLNAEIVERLEKYPDLVRLSMDVSYLRMENERLRVQLEEARKEVEKQRVLAAQLEHLLKEGSKDARQEQETLSEIELQFGKLKEQAQYLEKLKAEVLAVAKERDNLAQEHIREQAAVIERLSQSQKTNRMILSGLKKVFLNSADRGDDLKNLVEIFETIGEEDV